MLPHARVSVNDAGTYNRPVRPYLEDLALLACAFYATIPAFWLSLHPFTERWRARGRNAFRILVPLWWLYAALCALATWTLRHHHLYTSLYALIPGAVFILCGLALYRAATRNFTHVHVTGLAELEPTRHAQSLVTTGIRARVRHPIYLGHFCEMLGWTLCCGTYSLFILCLIALFTGALMLRLEDNELEQRFGPAYAQYRRTVPAILPRMF